MNHGEYASIGATNHSKYPRGENDFYITDPLAIRLLDRQKLLDKNNKYWECACGNGSLSKELTRLGYDVVSSDLFDRGYGKSGIDFLKCNDKFDGNIITNPPFSLLEKFILKGLDLTDNKLYIFARIQAIETLSRYNNIYKNNPPVWICPFVRRIRCFKQNDGKIEKGATCFAWFIWDNQDNSNETRVRWLI